MVWGGGGGGGLGCLGGLGNALFCGSRVSLEGGGVHGNSRSCAWVLYRYLGSLRFGIVDYGVAQRCGHVCLGVQPLDLQVAVPGCSAHLKSSMCEGFKVDHHLSNPITKQHF